MSNEYLDKSGLTYLWGKLKAFFVKGNARVFYGTCSSAGDAIAKVVTCSDFASTDLIAGAIITVKFDNTNSGAVGSLTLNVNGTGAKSIKYIYNGSYSNIPSAGYIKTGQIYQFTYDGTYWIVQMIYNTNSINQIKHDSAAWIAGPNKIYGYTLVMQIADGRWESIVLSYSTAKTKSKNPSGFRLGSIFVRHSSAAATAENTLDKTWCFYEVLTTVDGRYSFNIENTAALKFTQGNSLYLVGTIGTDGLFYLADTWWSQSLPTSADGKVYIYLGQVYDWYRFTLTAKHPIFKYVGGKVVELSSNGRILNADVPSDAKFTDTVTTATTSGSGNAVTAISASNGALTVTKGTTFLTSHQDISGKADKSATVSTVTWDSTNKKLTKTINGTTSDVVTAATLRTGLNVADGAEVNQNAFSNVKVGSTTVAADSKTDTLELVAGDNVTLTPDATNDKITISASGMTLEQLGIHASTREPTSADGDDGDIWLVYE